MTIPLKVTLFETDDISPNIVHIIIVLHLAIIQTLKRFQFEQLIIGGYDMLEMLEKMRLLYLVSNISS